MKKIKENKYPWRYHTSFSVLVDGSEYFSSMLENIKNAQFRILLEAYLFESGETANTFIKELCAAKNRGVEVYILLDEYGTLGLSSKDKMKLTSAGIELLLYHPVSLLHIGQSLKRDHRKLLIIDESTAFIGGAGITDEFSPEARNNYWHDVMLKIDGDIVFDLTHSFIDIWNEHKPTLNFDVPQVTTTDKISATKARVLISAGPEKNEIIRSVIARIRSSKQRIWLTSPYFISSWKVRRALRFAARKGVDVKLIFPGPYSDHKWVTYGIQRYYHRLLKANVEVYEYQPRFTHAKIIVCDGWYSLGSSNLDRWNQFLNLDANIEIYDKHSHQQIIQLFEKDFSESHLISFEKWTARSYIQHVKEIISGIMINILGYISQKFKR